MEKEKGLDWREKKVLKKTFKFERKGKTGEWKEYFQKDDIDYANKLFEKYKLDFFFENDYKKKFQ